MKCYQKFSMFEDQDTPMGYDCVPDQMKPIAQKNSRQQNFDIILNKYFNNGQLTDIQLQQLNEHQKTIVEEIQKKVESKTKRPDQYQKMFFKKAFKYAQHAFFKKNKKNRSRKMSQFYHYHFDIAAQKLNIPLINFYHPDKKTKPGLSTGQKSFNSSYVKTILKSQSFRKVCLEYHGKFRQECRKQRNKKIQTFSSSIYSMIQKNKQDITKSIRFLQSSKCKIPWTDNQIDEAIKRSAQDLDDFSLTQNVEKKQFERNHETKGQYKRQTKITSFYETKFQVYQYEKESQNNQFLGIKQFNDQEVQQKTVQHFYQDFDVSLSDVSQGKQLRAKFDQMQI